MKSRSNAWRCDVAEIRGRWSRLGERSFKKSSQQNNEKPTLAPAAKPNNTFPRRSKGSDWASPVGEILCIGLDHEIKRSRGWERTHQKAKIRQRKWGSPQTCLSSWEHLIALWCSWTFSSAWSSLFSSPRYHHHHHLDHYHHVRLNLPSFSQRNPLTMCPPTAATAPTLDEGDFFQGQDFIHYDSPGNRDTVY